MTQSFTYDGGALANVIRSTVQLTEQANHGEVGSGSWTVDDDAGTVDIKGHKLVSADQTSCSFARTWSGYVGTRNYARGQRHMTSVDREIAFNLVDINARLGFYVIRGRTWNRPRETISARLTALLASGFLSTLVVDDGFVDYPTDILDKNDYRGQYPLDVIRDMALVVGYNYFVYWSTNVNGAALWFRDSNSSTAFASTLQISNVRADIDSVTTFAASQDTSLERDPSQVYSGAFLPFAKGSVYRTRSATSAAFQPRDGVAPNSQVKTRAAAVRMADHYLFERRNEEDRITTSVRLPASKVNLVRAGQRIQAKFSHLATEGYGSYSYFRVLERTVSHPDNDDNSYDVRLVLSPQDCTGGTGAFVQQKEGHADGVTFTSPVTNGNLIVAVPFGGGAADVYEVDPRQGINCPVDTNATQVARGITATDDGGYNATGIQVLTAAGYSGPFDTSFACTFIDKSELELIEFSGVVSAGYEVLSKINQPQNFALNPIDVGTFSSAVTGNIVVASYIWNKAGGLPDPVVDPSVGHWTQLVDFSPSDMDWWWWVGYKVINTASSIVGDTPIQTSAGGRPWGGCAVLLKNCT